MRDDVVMMMRWGRGRKSVVCDGRPGQWWAVAWCVVICGPCQPWPWSHSAHRHRSAPGGAWGAADPPPCSSPADSQSEHSAPRQALLYLISHIRYASMIYYFLISSAYWPLCGHVSALLRRYICVWLRRRSAHRRPQDAPQRTTAPPAHRWHILASDAARSATECRKAPPRITRSRARRKAHRIVTR